MLSSDYEHKWICIYLSINLFLFRLFFFFWLTAGNSVYYIPRGNATSVFLSESCDNVHEIPSFHQFHKPKNLFLNDYFKAGYNPVIFQVNTHDIALPSACVQVSAVIWEAAKPRQLFGDNLCWSDLTQQDIQRWKADWHYLFGTGFDWDPSVLYQPAVLSHPLLQ